MTDEKHYAVLTDDTVFPLFLYHEDFPDGKLFKTREDWPDGPGWVDTPAKFDAKYVAPPVVEDGTLPRAAALAGYTPDRYPAHLYRKGDAENPLLIRDADHEAELLEKGDYKPDEYRESPDPKHKCWSDAPAPVSDLDSEETTVAPPAPPVPIDKALVQARKEGLWATTVDECAVKLADCPDLDTLAEIEAYERGNPKGARQGVLKAIAKRVAELKAPTA